MTLTVWVCQKMLLHLFWTLAMLSNKTRSLLLNILLIQTLVMILKILAGIYFVERVQVTPELKILVVNSHTGKDSRRPITDLGEFNFVNYALTFCEDNILLPFRFWELYPSSIRRAVLGSGHSDIIRFLSNPCSISNPFLCEGKTDEHSVSMMNQAWDALLSWTLRQVSDEDNNPDSILSAINASFCELMSGTLSVHSLGLISYLSKISVLLFSVFHSSYKECTMLWSSLTL